MKRLILLIISVLFAGSSVTFSASTYHRVLLNEHWELLQLQPAGSLPEGILEEKQDGWMDIRKMPEMVHDILVDHGVVDTLWKPGVLEKNQWISYHDWVYRTVFSLKAPEKPAYLYFAGLDGIVDVYVNGKLLASHQNMYLPLKVDITGILKKKNVLVLHFHTVFDLSGEQPVPMRRYRGNPIRRPWQNYINYLGPNPFLSKVGVFRDIYLVQPGTGEIEAITVGTDLNEDLSEGRVDFAAGGTCSGKHRSLEATLAGPDGAILVNKRWDLTGEGKDFTREGILHLEDPLLWYPRGYGDQPVYTLTVSLLVDGNIQHSLDKTVAFREVSMKELLHFIVNGVPVRLWGGDWVTPRSSTAVWDQSRAEKLFELAENANFNAFRVWGVVEPPADTFYEMADRRGFMVWQDFTNLPLEPDEESLAICRNESETMIQRLKNHPSIFAWCGGNENAMWHHQEFNGPLEDRGEWPGTKAADEIRKVLERLDPDRYFQPSTPYYGIDPNDPQEGNTHGYTNMWFVPGYDFINFASEDTRISCPVLPSLQKFMRPGEIFPEGYRDYRPYGTIYPFPETWLPYTTSSSWKKTGPVEEFYDATGAASLVHKIGMAEALYYQQTIEQQRRGRPGYDISDNRSCGGYIVWKFNDSWPQVYSAKVDYFLEPYHAYYTLKRAFQPVLVSIEKSNYLYIWLVNDSPEEIRGTVLIKAYHMDQQKVRKELQYPVSLQPDHSKVVVRLDTAGIGTLRKEHVISAAFYDESGKKIAGNTALLDIERNLVFPEATIRVRKSGDSLVLSSDTYAHCVTLRGNENGDRLHWMFDDNYFNLMPGEEKVVRVLGSHNNGTIYVKPWYSPHETIVDWKRQ